MVVDYFFQVYGIKVNCNLKNYLNIWHVYVHSIVKCLVFKNNNYCIPCVVVNIENIGCEIPFRRQCNKTQQEA